MIGTEVMHRLYEPGLTLVGISSAVAAPMREEDRSVAPTHLDPRWEPHLRRPVLLTCANSLPGRLQGVGEQLRSQEAPPSWRGLWRPDQSWQWKNSFTEPSGRWLKCSVEWFWNDEPSDPVPCTLKVKVPPTVLPFALNPPQVVNLPVKLGRLGSSSGSATNVPV
jgi:hypothetical protein